MNVGIVPLSAEHAASTFAIVSQDEVRRNVGIRHEPSTERTMAWIERAGRSDSIRAYAILEAGRHVGNLVLDEIDEILRTARISIYVDPRAGLGRGIGRLALRAALTEAFGPLNLYKVWLTVHTRNARAIAAYVAAGFSVEGVLRGEFLLDNVRVDVLRMAILAQEWRVAAD